MKSFDLKTIRDVVAAGIRDKHEDLEIQFRLSGYAMAEIEAGQLLADTRIESITMMEETSQSRWLANPDLIHLTLKDGTRLIAVMFKTGYWSGDECYVLLDIEKAIHGEPAWYRSSDILGDLHKFLDGMRIWKHQQEPEDKENLE